MLPYAGGLCILYLFTQFTHFFKEKCLKSVMHEMYENYFSEYNFLCWTVVIKVECDVPIQSAHSCSATQFLDEQ
jgi:hypothetical protein